MGDYMATREAVHGIAELLMAGPQWRTSQEISLRVRPGGGFATTHAPDIGFDGSTLIAGDVGVVLTGQTFAQAADALGVDAEGPTGVYTDVGPSTPDDAITIDPDHVRTLLKGYEVGDAALRAFAPDQAPVLWPEHFDLAVQVDNVDYGVSPGDHYYPQPYAYVGPGRRPDGEFWNASFGAASLIRDLQTPDAVRDFFDQGRALLA